MKTDIISNVEELFSLVGKKITFGYADFDNGCCKGVVTISKIERLYEEYRCFNSEGVFLFAGSFVTDGKKYGIKNGMYAGDDYDLITYSLVK